MTENKHTWVELDPDYYDGWGVNTPGDNTYSLIGPEGGDPVAVAVVNSAFGKDDDLNAIVAKIIAAPDMLAALKLARDEMGANAARDTVDAAIARAEGRSEGAQDV